MRCEKKKRGQKKETGGGGAITRHSWESHRFNGKPGHLCEESINSTYRGRKWERTQKE